MTDPAHLKRNKRSYQKKVDEHRCVTCGKQDERTLRGLRYCQVCLDRHKANASPRKPKTDAQRENDNATKREWRKKSMELGICSSCGTKDKRTVKGYGKCAICAAKKAKWQREHYDKEEKHVYYKNRRDMWREQGLCTYCGGKRDDTTKMLCTDCRVKARMQYRKRRANDGNSDHT